MKSFDRTRLVMRGLGWQGGTVHDLCKHIGCDVDMFLSSDAEGVGDLSSEFSQGWFATRTSPNYLQNIAPGRWRGSLNFWFGVAAGENCKELQS